MSKANENDSRASKQKRSEPSSRRVRGEGSVFQRESDGRWVARIPLGGGKRKEEYFDTMREAERGKRRMLNERDAGKLITERDQTLREYLDFWLKAHRATIRITTYAMYHRYLHTRIIPALGHIGMRKLSLEMFQSLYQEWEIEEGLSPNTIRLLHNIMKKALNDAVRWKKISYNPMQYAKVPPARKPINVYILNDGEVERLLQCVVQVRLYPLFKMALLLGLREGELLGLKWNDISFEQSTLKVQRTVYYVHDPDVNRRRFNEGPPKTEAGSRLLHLPLDIVEMLREHLKRQQEIRAVAPQWKDLDLVFCTRTGNYITPHSLEVAFDKVLQIAGLEHMKFHALRHNASLILRRMGVDSVVRKEMLGHSSLSMTDSVYGHTTSEMHKKAAEMIDNLFGGDKV